MSEDWYRRRNDRQMRYAGRVLPPGRPITLKLAPAYAESFDGQVTMLVGANLLARMTPALMLDLPKVRIVDPLPWAGADLAETILSLVHSIDPYASIEARRARDDDYILSLGRDAAANVVHGSGWYAFAGPGSSPIPDAGVPNPIGPSFAVLIAAAGLFGLELRPLGGRRLFNTFNWNTTMADTRLPWVGEDHDLGSIWTVGAGSVGTAALYFLTLATRAFRSLIFDMDVVKIENLDRSPIFVAADAECGRRKAEATASYLQGLGVAESRSECAALDESALWSSRRSGTPDLVIAAANERNVRYVIEQSYPPLQIYGTTGANWVASVLRHIPMVDPCSCCVFPPEAGRAAMTCAGASVPAHATQPEPVIDAALPFLSFSAGLMAAAEVLKSTFTEFPYSPPRTVLSLDPSIAPRLTSFQSSRRDRCVCRDRSQQVHRQMIAGSRYSALSSSR
jgi:hypothetical protein